jgi:predicted nucleic acid-binding protein
MGQHQRALVLDANILTRAVLGERILNLILEHRHRVHFFTPGVCIEDDWLSDYADTAKARIGKRDWADWPVLAGALALSCPIWTHDTDFFGVGVPTWTTEHIPVYFSD